MANTENDSGSTKVLVTGANGQLGQELQHLKSESNNWVFCSIDDLDITSDKHVNAMFQEVRPAFCINCAAYTNVDKAEEHPEDAYLVNADAIRNIKKACQKWNSILLHISSDYVYDNLIRRPLLETDLLSPKSVYAKSKLAGEEEVMTMRRSVILRTSWLYSSFGHNFVKTISSLCLQGKSLKVVDDQVGAPTYARDLANVIIKIIHTLDGSEADDQYKLFGIFNYANSGQTNWYEYANEIRRLLETQCLISPVSTADYGALAARPEYSVLNCEKIKTYYKIGEIPHWKVSLKSCLSIITGNDN